MCQIEESKKTIVIERRISQVAEKLAGVYKGVAKVQARRQYVHTTKVIEGLRKRLLDLQALAVLHTPACPLHVVVRPTDSPQVSLRVGNMRVRPDVCVPAAHSVYPVFQDGV